MKKRGEEGARDRGREGDRYTNIHCRFSCTHVDRTRTHALHTHTNIHTLSWWSI